jgi:hypothetical protein
MSRVDYANENIRKAMDLLDQLEQSIGFNMRCAFPGDYQRPGDDYHQGAMDALVQTLGYFPKVRRVLDDVEAEVLDVFLHAQEVEKKAKEDGRWTSVHRADCVKIPQTAAEYITYAETWIDALDHTDSLNERWRDEKGLRNAACVKGEDREVLLNRLDRKCGDLARAFYHARQHQGLTDADIPY